ncbi:hypothetical protein Salat_1709000, partial [Sesamum alatum]
MADPHLPSSSQPPSNLISPNPTQPPSQSSPQIIPPPNPLPPTTPAKKSYSSIVQHPTASHFQHDPVRAAKKSFQNEELTQMGEHLGHDQNSCLSKPKSDTTRAESNLTLKKPQGTEHNNNLGVDTNEAAVKKSTRVMFSEQHSTLLNPEVTAETSGKDSGKHNTEIPSTVNLNVTELDATHQTHTQEIAEDSEDDFNYDDPIITELLDKDWDKELETHRRSPKDKAAQYDINNTKTGITGGQKKTKGPQQQSHTFNQNEFIQAWSVEECESDIVAALKDTTRTLLKGDTSINKNLDIQEVNSMSEEEEETTPIYNRFQTLQNLEEEETQPPKLYTLNNNEATIQMTEEGSQKQQGMDQSLEVSQASSHNFMQKQLLMDSASSKKHKRNKSHEEVSTQESPKIASKGKRAR